MLAYYEPHPACTRGFYNPCEVFQGKTQAEVAAESLKLCVFEGQMQCGLLRPTWHWASHMVAGRGS